MDKKEQILHYHRIDGLSQREIARRARWRCFRRPARRLEVSSLQAAKGEIQSCITHHPTESV